MLADREPFYLNRLMLTYVGLYQPKCESRAAHRLYKWYSHFAFVYLYFVFVGAEVAQAFTIRLLIRENFQIHLGTIKAILWKWRGKRIDHVIRTLENPGFDYEDFGEFKPSQIRAIAHKTGVYNAILFLFMVVLAVSMRCFPKLYINGVVVDSVANVTLPIPMYLPYDYNRSQMAYVAWGLFEWFFTCVLCVGIVGNDTTFMNIMNFTAMHLKIIGGAFRTIRERAEQRVQAQGGNLAEEMNREVIKCIQYLETIYWAVDSIEGMFQYVIMLQGIFTLSSMTFTFLYLAIVRMTRDDQFVSRIFYVLAATMQLQLYCWFGNNVYSEALDVKQNIYDSNWIGSDKQFTKSILITMTRLERPLYFTYGKFAPLTLQSMVFIMKTAYSFTAILKGK